MKTYLALISAAVLALSACSQKAEEPAQASAPQQEVAPASEPTAPAESASAPAASETTPATESASAAEATTDAAGPKADGKAIFESTCKLCHGGNIPGAPVVGKKEDWAVRIKQGQETLHKHALEGFNSMPAKGGNASLSDDEVKAAVDYMANQSGAKF